MASFRKSGSGWRAEVARNGVRESATFPTKREAQEWAAVHRRVDLHGVVVLQFQNLLSLLAVARCMAGRQAHDFPEHPAGPALGQIGQATWRERGGQFG